MKYEEIRKLQTEGQPKQHQDRQPGFEDNEMDPQPVYDDPDYRGSGKLEDRVVLITGGDSGIGRAVAIAAAKEGAKVAIAYWDEHEDAETTKKLVEEKGVSCILFDGDLADEEHCQKVVKETVDHFGQLNCLINNAAEQHFAKDLRDISKEQMERTFQSNIYGPFHITKAALDHLEPGSTIVNSVSIVAYKGMPVLMDYAATKGALVALTRSLSENLVADGIRVNGVAPGPIWTPLIPASFPEEQVAEFGTSSPMGRPGQPAELAPAYIFLASDDSSYVSGQVIHVNGGQVVNS
ncbi:SDR family oxidoreductase [Alkalicoccus daliensis]|uniref:NAD(P)-dependent dehydrogenase, short-chain alcohol dehydrogenase family n=1 Tax=Alkalicoccus daliensis TaxID=745820 RepID=A0A1H0KNE8_9BACI|nr:SDR family oxidoreductase [Alkalicoccus daliensis]SDO57458.1 NAD(P)-dependent dehydrogenase, short-chain alcohol dehydrogenase family [Alkalicoccus daliensis]